MKKFIKVSFAVIFTFLLCTNLSTASSSTQNSLQALVGITMRVSVSSDGTQGNDFTVSPSISADGRYVAFVSGSTNLVAWDTNYAADIFVHDRVTGETTRVSVTSDGTQGDGTSASPVISIDGRYITFTSSSSNLVLGDINGHEDIFVHDRVTGKTTRVSVSSEGGYGDFGSFNPSISGDGRYVAFDSDADNLVVGDTNIASDIFVHDRMTGETTRISVTSDGTQGNYRSLLPSISADGRYITFDSGADNLVAGDTNNSMDIFVHDRVTRETTRISVASDGAQGNEGSLLPSISADGRYVAFFSWASNLVVGDSNGSGDIFVHDRVTRETTCVSVASDGTQGNRYSFFPSISADDRYVAFDSWASNLVVGDTNGVSDIFVHDRVTGETSRVSVSTDGMQGNQNSETTSISADGRYVAFISQASNLVVGDTNGIPDVFVRDREGLVIGYSVSGHVTDSDGNPLPGVNISAGYGYNAITDSQGDYSISGLPSGTFRIFPSLTDIFFAPSWRMVSVPPERVGINFTEGFPTYFPIVGR